MIALETSINGHRVCLAGIGDDGVLHVIVNCCLRSEPIKNVKAQADDDDEWESVFLSIGGLDSRTEEHINWKPPSIGVGSEILVRVVESENVDPPDERIRYEKNTCVDEFRQHLRECSAWLTPEERKILIRELTTELETANNSIPVGEKQIPLYLGLNLSKPSVSASGIIE